MPATTFDDEKPVDNTSNAGGPAPGFTDVGKVSLQPDYVRDAALPAGTEVKVLLEVTGSSTTVGRMGLDLVVVLDVSRSMGDDGKLDKLKSAMQFVIKKLTPMDRLSIITFNNSAEKKCKLSSMSDAAKTTLGGIVNGLVANGGTNIKAGLETGLATINGRKFKGENRATIILLVSDGEQNDGDARQVSVPADVPVYTLGFGRGTDNKLLNDLKKNGGTFSPVRDGGDMTAVFSQLVAGFLTVLVQDLQLTLTKPDPTDLDKILRVDPGDYTTEPVNGPFDTEVTVNFGILFSGEVRKVVVYLSLIQAKGNGGYTNDLLEMKVSYPNSQGNGRQTIRGETLDIKRIETPSSEHAGSITAKRTLAEDDKLDEAMVDAQNALEDILDQTNPMVAMLRTELEQLLNVAPSMVVKREILRVEAAEDMSLARAAAERGDYADAARILDARRESVSLSAPAVSGDATCMALVAELHELSLRVSDEREYRRTGRACLLASMSSHAQQRASSVRLSRPMSSSGLQFGCTGSSVFATPAMRQMEKLSVARRELQQEPAPASPVNAGNKTIPRSRLEARLTLAVPHLRYTNKLLHKPANSPFSRGFLQIPRRNGLFMSSSTSSSSAMLYH